MNAINLDRRCRMIIHVLISDTCVCSNAITTAVAELASRARRTSSKALASRMLASGRMNQHAARYSTADMCVFQSGSMFRATSESSDYLFPCLESPQDSCADLQLCGGGGARGAQGSCTSTSTLHEHGTDETFVQDCPHLSDKLGLSGCRGGTGEGWPSPYVARSVYRRRHHSAEDELDDVTGGWKQWR